MNERRFRTAKLGEIALAIKDGTHGTHERLMNGIPLLSAKNVTAAGKLRVTDNEELISELDYKIITSTFAPQKGDLLITIVGSIGRRAIFDGSRVAFQRSVAFVRPSDQVTAAYLFYAVGQDEFVRQMEQRANATAQSGLYLSEVAKLEITLPDAAAQASISTVLTTLDKVIDGTEARIDKYKKIKAGMMQDLFTRGLLPDGRLRPTHEEAPDLYHDSPLGAIPNEWAHEPLGKSLLAIEAGNSPECPDTPAQGDDWGVLKVGAVNPEGLKENENKVVLSRSLRQAALLIKNHDLLMSRANTVDLVGLVCQVTGSPHNLMLSDKTLRLRVNQSLAKTRFLFWALQSSKSRRQIETLASGTSGSMKNISQAGIRSIQIPRPNLAEQTLITARLDGIGRVVNALKLDVAKLTNLRSGLTQELLTGRVRVNLTKSATTTA